MAARIDASTAPSPRRRMSAEARRAAVVAVAVAEFAQHGYEGTATDAIANRAGVSQPYLFQLFGTKRDLFLATVRTVFARVWSAFEAAADEARAVDPSMESILHAMADAYCVLLRDRDLLRCQLNAYAACSDDEIRAAVRAEFADLYRRVGEASGAPADVLDDWFARGMLFNLIAAIAPDLADRGDYFSLAMLTPVEGMIAPIAEPPAGSKAAAIAAKARQAAEKARALGKPAPTPKTRSRTKA
ncbi:MAG: TetR/AcrR family transcriptional regulator [Bauldia sp.]